MIFSRRVPLALLTALSIFALSATASAATYTVNSTGNQEPNRVSICGAAETCTLRAAICKLDKKPFKPCRSPKKYKRLKPGKHVFQVRAIDAAGNRDKTPETRRFRVAARR